MPRNVLIGILTAALACLLAVGGFAGMAAMLGAPDPADADRQAFEVVRGESFRQVASRLEEAGFIRSKTAFRLLGDVRDADRQLKAGYYSLSRSMAADQVLRQLISGGDQVRVTIPEGWEMAQIAMLMETKRLAGADQFLAGAADVAPHLARHAWLAALPPGATLEGFLFPDTYSVSGGALSVQSLIGMMLARFEEVAWQKIKDGSGNLSAFQIVTLASIVEREAVKPDERPLIAGIYLNRLRIGMKLGADPTVEYVLRRRQDATHNLTLADVSVDSPYNTYKYRGLPPGPIANPGLASIEATLAPAHSDYLYFVAKGDGAHAFSRTYGEQRSAQRRYQRHR
ncbi:MAG: endolytic transglycosylase MltG [Candidatus Sericytochromatia bacterium]|uniref:Endolytic murein transglycosylase n=1 Tax=Candidatus Tanganyikabacteria bacterium TaxID=2961651 RepID=A0A938BHL2_9BACT|nr:endolytic transglycosylase MltG [Candidatus Tanganyikabacteria bacterium]